MIRLNFDKDKYYFEYSFMRENSNQQLMELELLESKLEVALEIAHSRFRLRNRGIIARLFAGIIDKISKR